MFDERTLSYQHPLIFVQLDIYSPRYDITPRPLVGRI